jgi:hypothetical protein
MWRCWISPDDNPAPVRALVGPGSVAGFGTKPGRPHSRTVQDFIALDRSTAELTDVRL